MILGIEIALIVLGIMALVKGKIQLSKNRVVQGTPARLLAIVCFAPLPLAFMSGIAYGAYLATQGGDLESHKWIFIAIEAGVVVACLALLFILGFALATSPAPETPRVEIGDWDRDLGRDRRRRDDRIEKRDDRIEPPADPR